MSTPAPSVAAPAVAVPASQPAPVVAPVAATPAPDAKPAGRGSKLFGLLAAEAEVPPGTKPEVKKPEVKPAAAPATPAPDGKDPAAAPAPAADTGEKPIRAVKTKAIDKRPGLPTSTQAAAAPAAAPATASAAPESDADLIDEEKQMIEEATEAEKYLPGRKGLVDKTRKFIRAHQKFIEAHPDIESDPDEKAAYNAFLKANRPAISASEQRTITENRITAKVAQPFEQKAAEMEHQLYVRDQEPIMRDQRQRVSSELNSVAMPAEVLEFAQKYGVEVAKKEFAGELKAVQEVVAVASEDYDELVRLETYNPKGGRPLSTPARDEKDPKFVQHQRLLGIMQKVDGDFKETAKQSELLRDGKWFVTREEWDGIPVAERHKFWHFTNREVATRMLQWVKPAVEARIAQRRQQYAEDGYERRKYVPPAPAPAAPPVPVRSPSGPGASPVPAPSGAQPPATAGSRLLSALTAD